MWPGHPTDRKRRFVITDTLIVEGGANLVTLDGEPYGCYLDDSTPNLADWVKKAVADSTVGYVLVSVPMAFPHRRWGPADRVINLLEWYPHNAGIPVPKLVHCKGYIVQRHYPGYLHDEMPKRSYEPPTYQQYLGWRAEVDKFSPVIVLDF